MAGVRRLACEECDADVVGDPTAVFPPSSCALSVPRSLLTVYNAGLRPLGPQEAASHALSSDELASGSSSSSLARVPWRACGPESPCSTARDCCLWLSPSYYADLKVSGCSF